MWGRHARTKAEPIQPIPLFQELVDMLLEVSQIPWRQGRKADGWDQPENRHVVLNVGLRLGRGAGLMAHRSTARSKMTRRRYL